MALLRKWYHVYRLEGFFPSLWRGFGFLYERLLRPHLPEKENPEARLNGVLALYPHAKWLDDVIGVINYEGPLIRGIGQVVDRGDDVVIVGGGYGVSAVTAARKVGRAGRVVVYEASEEMVCLINESATINGIDNIDVTHAIVSEARSLYGSAGDAKVFAPDELPNCDVLVLDCEGAESNILADLTIAPKSIVVETHGHFESPPCRVTNLLTERDFMINERIVMSEDKGVHVIVAERMAPESGG